MNKSDGSESMSSGRRVVLVIVSSATVVGQWPRSQQEADIENMEGESDEQWWVEVEASIALQCIARTGSSIFSKGNTTYSGNVKKNALKSKSAYPKKLCA